MNHPATRPASRGNGAYSLQRFFALPPANDGTALWITSGFGPAVLWRWSVYSPTALHRRPAENLEGHTWIAKDILLLPRACANQAILRHRFITHLRKAQNISHFKRTQNTSTRDLFQPGHPTSAQNAGRLSLARGCHLILHDGEAKEPLLLFFAKFINRNTMFKP